MYSEKIGIEIAVRAEKKKGKAKVDKIYSVLVTPVKIRVLIVT